MSTFVWACVASGSFIVKFAATIVLKLYSEWVDNIKLIVKLSVIMSTLCIHKHFILCMAWDLGKA